MVNFPRILLSPWLQFLVAGLAVATGARGDAPAESELRLAIIVSRHGICAPGGHDELDPYVGSPWPRWSDPLGQLTAHGQRQMTLLGAYYRARYVDAGLLTGRAEQDIGRIYFRANSDQRTLESARRLGAGLLPDGAPTVHALPPGQLDPLFRPNLIPIGRADKALADAAVLGRMGNDPAAVVRAHEATFAALQRVMYGGEDAVPPGKKPLLAEPATVAPALGSHLVSLGGPLRLGMVFPDTFLMEYAEGRPMADVGWGRVTRRSLTQLLELHSLYYDLTQRTLYPAQVQGSNLASHLLQTLEQAVAGQPVEGAIGSPADRLVVVVGHDTNLLNLSGLMGLSWLLPDTQPNLVAPGGALIFELRRRLADGQFLVRVCYVGESLDQMRDLRPVTLAEPPPIAPIFIPSVSAATPGYDAPFPKFAALLRRVIDPEFVTAERIAPR